MLVTPPTSPHTRTHVCSFVSYCRNVDIVLKFIAKDASFGQAVIAVIIFILQICSNANV